MTDRPCWAARLQAERERRGWNKHEMARRLIKAKGSAYLVRTVVRQIHSWEGGEHYPRDWTAAYASAFDMSEYELFGDRWRSPESPMVVAWAGGRIPGGAWPLLLELLGVSVEEIGVADDWEAMERRLLLRLALGTGAGVLGSSGERLQHLLDRVMTSEPRDLDEWRRACRDHLYAIRTRPARKVNDDLIYDILTVRRQLAAPGANDVTELQRVLAGLSSLRANVLTRLGDHGAALRWWRTAREAADASGDLESRLMVRAAEAGFGLYGQRAPATVLGLTQQAQRLAEGRQSLGLAYITGTQAKALSLLGRHQEARRALRTFVDAAPESAPESVIPAYWTNDQVYFTQSWVHAAAGDETPADEARGRILSPMTLDYQYPANARLHEALCMVVNGGVDRGARLATEVLDSVQPYRNHMIEEVGCHVLRAVPPEQRERPAVREFREVLAAAS